MRCTVGGVPREEDARGAAGSPGTAGKGLGAVLGAGEGHGPAMALPAGRAGPGAARSPQAALGGAGRGAGRGAGPGAAVSPPRDAPSPAGGARRRQSEAGAGDGGSSPAQRPRGQRRRRPGARPAAAAAPLRRRHHPQRYGGRGSALGPGWGALRGEGGSRSGERGGARVAPVAAGPGRARSASVAPGRAPSARWSRGGAPGGGGGWRVQPRVAARRGQPLLVSMGAASPAARGVISGPAIKN